MTDEPRAPVALRIAVTAAILALAFAGSWNHDLFLYDEPREAELARALWRSGEWTYTVLNGQPFLEKPPFFSASVAASFALVGAPSILAARVVAILWSLVTLGVVAWFARRTAGPRAALLAPLVLATTNRFVTCQHTILLDNALVAFTTAALAFGHVAVLERSRRLAVLAGAALAGAFLAKGLVGVGVVVLVLGLEVAWRRDGPGARALLHPLALLAAVGPPALYAALLASRGGASLCEELFWDNQVGRFLHGHASRPSDWHIYFSTWPEMVAPWSPLALLAIARPPAGRTPRFLALWAVAPLVVLSFSAARSRNYAIPVTPGHALLVAAWWTETSLGPRARTLLASAWLVAAVAIAGLAGAIAWLGGACSVSLLGGVVALASLRARRAASRETVGLGLGLCVLAGWLIFASAFVASLREERLCLRDLAEGVWIRAGSRRLVVYHLNDSYSGAFPFYGDRAVLGLDEARDPRGEQLVAAVGSNDVVLAPAGALDLLPAERQREFVPEGSFPVRKGQGHELVLYRRRASP